MSTEKNTLSKAQRHEIYKHLLERSSKPGFSRQSFERLETDGPTEDDEVPGLCWALSHLGHYVYEPELMERKFPELYAQNSHPTDQRLARSYRLVAILCSVCAAILAWIGLNGGSFHGGDMHYDWLFIPIVALVVAAVFAVDRSKELRHPAAIRLVQRESLWFVERRHAGKGWFNVGDYRGTKDEQLARRTYATAIEDAKLERQRQLPGVERDITPLAET